MDNIGLTSKFAVNRPLTPQEVEQRLLQKLRLPVEPHYQLSIIKCNSTYLESIDKWYGEKGLITAIVTVGMLIFGGFGGAMIWISLSKYLGFTPKVSDNSNYLLHAVVIAAILAPIFTGLTWLLRKESFAYTHYPIRFNRISKMVHVFQPTGTILSVPWNEIFFTIAQADHVYKFMNVFGHVLDKDKLTVKSTFALSVSETSSPEGITLLKSHWEFIRRYMEEGPEAVTSQIEFCLPVSEQKESLMFGVRRLMANSSVASPIMYPIILFSLLFSLLTVPFRYFSIRTSKIPRWPQEIEKECTVAVNDPYAIYGDARGERLAVFPEAAASAGVAFVGPPKNPLRP